MAMAEPEDMDEIFRRMTEDLDVGAEHLGVVSFTSLQDGELLVRFNQIKEELREREELLNPHTDTGRDLSAQYHAALYEIKKRRLM